MACNELVARLVNMTRRSNYACLTQLCSHVQLIRWGKVDCQLLSLFYRVSNRSALCTLLHLCLSFLWNFLNYFRCGVCSVSLDVESERFSGN